jgi:stage V sporulation protein G
MSDISVSEIQIVPVRPNNGLVAFASCVVNNSLYLGNIALYTSPSNTSGFRLVYPAKILPNGKEINCVHPINRETGAAITAAIIDKYEDLIRRGTT